VPARAITIGFALEAGLSARNLRFTARLSVINLGLLAGIVRLLAGRRFLLAWRAGRCSVTLRELRWVPRCSARPATGMGNVGPRGADPGGNGLKRAYLLLERRAWPVPHHTLHVDLLHRRLLPGLDL